MLWFRPPLYTYTATLLSILGLAAVAELIVCVLETNSGELVSFHQHQHRNLRSLADFNNQSSVILRDVDGLNGTTVPTPESPSQAEMEARQSTEPVGWKTIKNNHNRALCMDLQWGQARDSQPVRLYGCNGTPSQKWLYDGLGRIHSGVNKKFCLSGLHDNLFIHSCSSSSVYQQWDLFTDGSIRSRAHGKYVGVSCEGLINNDGIGQFDLLELQTYMYMCDNSSQLKKWTVIGHRATVDQ
jgi:hypothetical protein